MHPDSKVLRIAISSLSGCGNTTATMNVGRTLGLKVVNYTFRDLAADIGISFEEIHERSQQNRTFDYLTDLNQIRLSLQPKVVVGSRLAAWLVNADLRVWLQASLEERAKRIFRREVEKGLTYESVLYRTLQRDEQNRKRYLQLYGLDSNDRSDFDIIINTEKLTAEQVSSLIIAAARWASQNQLDRKNLHLQRIRNILSDSLKIDPAVVIDPSLSVDLKAIYQAQAS
ncbi:MAG TPA: cytidylate kinase family protein [Chthoniobacterales bacterium]|nr:cytidylate kinase family protein [Chthoniobacterales bacterium]